MDGGAHHGVVTAKLARYFGRVVAIEPGPLAGRITGAQVVRAALGNEAGPLRHGRWPLEHRAAPRWCQAMRWR